MNISRWFKSQHDNEKFFPRCSITKQWYKYNLKNCELTEFMCYWMVNLQNSCATEWWTHRIHVLQNGELTEFMCYRMVNSQNSCAYRMVNSQNSCATEWWTHRIHVFHHDIGSLGGSGHGRVDESSNGQLEGLNSLTSQFCLLFPWEEKQILEYKTLHERKIITLRRLVEDTTWKNTTLCEAWVLEGLLD